MSKSSYKLKPTGVDLDTYKVNPKKQPRWKLRPGVKKGTGGVAEASSFSLMQSVVTEAIEDITDTPDGSQFIGRPQTDAASMTDGSPGQDAGLVRYVKGAHLVYKRQSDADSYEELWLYKIEPNNPTEHAKIEKLILAGTDIDMNTMSSEDGGQRAHTWVAGNAKMMHITGLPN